MAPLPDCRYFLLFVSYTSIAATYPLILIAYVVVDVMFLLPERFQSICSRIQSRHVFMVVMMLGATSAGIVGLGAIGVSHGKTTNFVRVKGVAG